MAKPTAPETVALIRALQSGGVENAAIALRAGVSLATVERYLRGDRYPPPRRRSESRNPIFDPDRDGVPEQSLTARLCGDPYPGRRELVAANRANEPAPPGSPPAWP